MENAEAPALFARLPEVAGRIPWLGLTDGVPTPVERLGQLGARFGLRELWVKRDDRTSSQYGGNKVRKLEWLLADARSETFVSQNKEGLFSVPGYVALYFLGVGVGVWMEKWLALDASRARKKVEGLVAELETRARHARESALEAAKTARDPEARETMLADGHGDFELVAGEDILDVTFTGEDPPAPGAGAARLARFIHLADMQLRVLWEEILERFSDIEVMGEPRHVRSNFVRGYTHLPVRVTRH